MNKNAEGYSDPTAEEACRNISREERLRTAERLAAINEMIDILKKTAELVGFEVVGRIELKDKKTGKVYK